MNIDTAQLNMIKQQLRTGDVLNEAIIDLYQALPRDAFVPKAYQAFAYSDFKIPLAHQQKMLTPLEEATILQALNLQGNETVLEIGTGCGYMTALLAKCAQQVISVDCFEEMTKAAQKNIEAFDIENVSLITGDAHRGWMDNAPYDVIVISGALSYLDDIFKPQLMKQGKLFAIIGDGHVMQGRLFTLDAEEQWQQQVLFDTTVAPLQNKGEGSTFIF